MGQAYAEITLCNPPRADVGPVTVRMMADTGATLSIIPESVALQLDLDLDAYPRRPARLADGRTRQFPFVGPIEFRFKGRLSLGGALVMESDPVLGAVQMEDMDLIVEPMRRLIDVNPSHPNKAVVRA